MRYPFTTAFASGAGPGIDPYDRPKDTLRRECVSLRSSNVRLVMVVILPPSYGAPFRPLSLYGHDKMRGYLNSLRFCRYLRDSFVTVVRIVSLPKIVRRCRPHGLVVQNTVSSSSMGGYILRSCPSEACLAMQQVRSSAKSIHPTGENKGIVLVCPSPQPPRSPPVGCRLNGEEKRPKKLRWAKRRQLPEAHRKEM